jgi:hypothetical protein
MSLLNKLKALVFPEPASPGDPPSWVDRLQDARFVSLSGIEIPFQYVDLSTFFVKKTAVFENVNADGVYVQDNGVGGVRFPMVCYFEGDRHDIEARAFMKAILERGEGTLYHPIFGAVVVIPVGEIENVSALVSAANQTTITVEFFETTGLQIGDLPPFDSLLDAFETDAAVEFGDKLNVTDVADEQNFINRFNRRINQVSDTLSSISSALSTQQGNIDDIGDSITRSIDVLVGQPLALARQTQLLIASPANIAAAATDKLKAYANLAREIFGLLPTPTGYDFSAENGFHGDSLIAGGCVAYHAVAANDNDFTTSNEFIAAASGIGALLEEFSTWSDDAYTAIGEDTPETADTGDGWLQLQELGTAVISNLVTQSLSALRPIRITLDRERGTQELCYELYRTSKPAQLDFFASTNDFSGDEYFTLQEGREIVYFV